jgi:hypothetical protein
MKLQARAAIFAREAFPVDAVVCQPDEVEERRILRALKRRARYRYVSPELRAEPDGFRILSPCCSRNVDATGGMIDIALLVRGAAPGAWLLYSRKHAEAAWELQGTGRLHVLLELLCSDPQRIFWK